MATIAQVVNDQDYYPQWGDQPRTLRHTTYPSCTPEWFAQQWARFVEENELVYDEKQWKRDIAQEQRDQLAEYLKQNNTQTGRRVAQHKEEKWTVAPFQPTHGVVTEDSLYLMSTSGEMQKLVRVAIPTIVHVGSLIELAYQYGLLSLWVLPTSQLSNNFTASWVQSTPSDLYGMKVTYSSEESGYFPKFIKGWQKGSKTVYIWVTENCERWDKGIQAHQKTSTNTLRMIDNPALLFVTIMYAEHSLGSPLLYSPGYTGRSMMKNHNTGKREKWIVECDHTGIPYPQANDLDFKKELTPDERQKKYFVGYDKRAMYLGVCAGLNLGEGTPILEQKPTFNKKYPGLWYCKVTGTSPFAGLPHPTLSRGKSREEGWFFTSTVQNLKECGYDVDISQAYIWHTYHQTLRSWSDTLNNARTTLKKDIETYKNEVARTLARNMIKNVYTQAIGWLDLKQDDDDQTTSEATTETKHAGDIWNRPDIRRQIVEEAKHRMFARMRLLVENGYIPVGADVDALYFVTDEIDPSLAIPQMMNYEGRGGFDHKYTVPLEKILPIYGTKKTMHAVNTEILNLIKAEEN